MLCPDIEVRVKVNRVRIVCQIIVRLGATALQVQSYLVQFKTVTNLKVGIVFDFKEDKSSDGVLLKPSMVAP